MWQVKHLCVAVQPQTLAVRYVNLTVTYHLGPCWNFISRWAAGVCGDVAFFQLHRNFTNLLLQNGLRLRWTCIGILWGFFNTLSLAYMRFSTDRCRSCPITVQRFDPWLRRPLRVQSGSKVPSLLSIRTCDRISSGLAALSLLYVIARRSLFVWYPKPKRSSKFTPRFAMKLKQCICMSDLSTLHQASPTQVPTSGISNVLPPTLKLTSL